MRGIVLAEFSTAARASEAVRHAREASRPAMDVLSPVPLEGLAGNLSPPHPSRPIGWIMFIAGAIGGAVGWTMQWYSAVIDYPIISGGRPLNSWPAFLLVPYETTILFAGVVGLLGWMWMCGLPKLFHPLFAVEAVERAVQDRFLLVFAGGDGTARFIETELKPDAVYEVRE